MNFVRLPASEAEGAILAHATWLDDRRLKKGTVLSASHVAKIVAAGIADVTVARLEDGDLTEDAAAARIAEALAGERIGAAPATTGRVNLFAGESGLFLPDRALVDAINAVDAGITLATLDDHAPVETGRMVATVKIIPLAVAGAAVEAVCALLAGTRAIDVAPYRARRVSLVQTRLEATKETVLDKTRRITQARLDTSGSTIVEERRCGHDADDLAATLGEIREADLIVIFGASAIVDIDDVIPDALRRAGGRVRHLGMPVDPGNLLMLGERHGVAVIGAPGCARSPKENGFDWVLNRLLAGLDVSAEVIRGMGVGGLLEEIASRPQPREASDVSGEDGVDIVVLAAGRSRRMGETNKLLARVAGTTLVRRAIDAALASRQARRVRVVTGHDREAVEAEIADRNVERVHNPDYRNGLSTSLKAGFFASMRDGAAGVLVMLADQPFVTTVHLDRLIEAFRPHGEGSIVAAADGERRFNPVILSTAYADEIDRLAGDVGARAVLDAHAGIVATVDIGEAASRDVDTPEALEAAEGALASIHR